MYVIYSEAHRLHHPPFEIAEGGARLPMSESPERMARLLEALQQTAWADFAGPIGDLTVVTAGFGAFGRCSAALNLPALIVTEGGYNTEHLGTNTVAMVQGFIA